jgi:hypothetical protein
MTEPVQVMPSREAPSGGWPGWLAPAIIGILVVGILAWLVATNG